MRTVAVHAARVYDRSYVLAIFTLVYVALAAMQQRGVSADAVAVLLGGPLALGWLWRHTRLSEGLEANVHPVALGALRFAAWGAALWVAARTGPAGRPGFDTAANLGLGLAIVAAQVALARIPGNGGLLRPPRSATALDAAAFCALFWGVAVALPAARSLLSGQGVLLDPLATDYATSAASVASILSLGGAAARARLTRQLELGVHGRASGALVSCATALSVVVPAALLELLPPDRALPLGALAAALACAWAATTPDATRVASGLRIALVVMLLGAPLALTAAGLAQHMPGYAGLITLCGAAATLGVGMFARAAAKPLTAEQSRWLTAIEAAGRAAREPDPDTAIVATLSALQRLEQAVTVRPELWRQDPPEVLRVDVAGYLHTERAAAPAAIYELGKEEPERTLRRDVLGALTVRRPEVRELIGWMDARDALFVTLVTDSEVPLGLLVFPKGSRKSPLSLQEAVAARQLCDRLSSVLSLSSSIARSRQRETDARERADELVVEAAKLEAIIELTSRPHDYLLDALAAGVQVAAYSAPARSVLDAIAKLAAARSDVVLEVPVGVDALGYAALVHLSGARRAGPFVLVDGTAAVVHAPECFRGVADTPVARARGGTLLVLNLAALPMAAQDALAVALSERPSDEGGGGVPFTLVATLARSSAELFEARLLSRALARFVLPNTLVLPSLAERPEDLRALILDRLCRAGVRGDGQTLGIEPRALGLLVDHEWPGNLAELDHIVSRAARSATGDRVRVVDLEAAGFVTEDGASGVPLAGLASSMPKARGAAPRVVPSSIPVSGVQRSRQELGAEDDEPAADAASATTTTEPKVRRRRRR
jgi:DNA-binding NtrC family response regulator